MRVLVRTPGCSIDAFLEKKHICAQVAVQSVRQQDKMDLFLFGSLRWVVWVLRRLRILGHRLGIYTSRLSHVGSLFDGGERWAIPQTVCIVNMSSDGL